MSSLFVYFIKLYQKFISPLLEVLVDLTRLALTMRL